MDVAITSLTLAVQFRRALVYFSPSRSKKPPLEENLSDHHAVAADKRGSLLLGIRRRCVDFPSSLSSHNHGNVRGSIMCDTCDGYFVTETRVFQTC